MTLRTTNLVISLGSISSGNRLRILRIGKRDSVDLWTCNR